MTYYLSPRFLNKLAVHITKNYLDLPQVKVPLILGIHGRKGEGKTFQCELVFRRMGVEVVHISGGELESPDAGDPARLIRLRYREAAELVRVRGQMAVLMINDLDAGAGRFDRMTQYTVNTQLVNNTLMNIADNPTNVQLPGSYDEKALPRIPIVATGNDFATLYAPLIRDGRMQKFYWEPSREDRIGIVGGMFAEDDLRQGDVEKLVERFDNQAIDFFGAVRSQIYDEQITQFIHSVGIENISSRVVNTLEMPAFARPNFQLERLIAVGETLVREQVRVRTMGLVSEYNQAITPAGRTFRDRRYEESALLVPPAENPIGPYRQPHRQTHQQSASGPSNSASRSNSSFKKLARRDFAASNQQNGEPEHRPQAGGTVEAAEPPLSENVKQQLHDLMLAGTRLGIEHADRRRFRTNSWQSYATVVSEAEAARSLSACLSQFPHHYIRLLSIDSRTRQRLTETVVHRPQP